MKNLILFDVDVNLKNPGIIDITLKPKEIFLGERGSMSSCDGGIKYKPIEVNLFKSFKRWIGGESFLSIVQFENVENFNQNLKLRYDYQYNGFFHNNKPSTNILIVDLSKIEGNLIIKSGAFFAATSGVKVESFIDRNLKRSLFGFGSIINQEISGRGTVFIQKNMFLSLNEIKVLKGEKLIIDPKEVYAYSSKSLVNQNDNSLNNFISGEGLSSYKFEGPATIFTYKHKPLDNNGLQNWGCFRQITLVLIILFLIRLIF